MAGVSSAEVKGGGVRNAAEGVRVRCHLCSVGCPPPGTLESGVACNLGCVDGVLPGADLSVVC